MKALIVLRALKRKCGCSCARQTLQLRFDEPALELGGPERQGIGLFRAASHLLRVAPRERDAGESRHKSAGPNTSNEIEGAEVVGQGAAKESRRQAQEDRRGREDDGERHVQAQPGGSVVAAARRRSTQNTQGATSPQAYQRGSVQAKAFCQVRPAKYSWVAKKTAVAVQSRNTPKPIASLRPSDRGRPMPESIGGGSGEAVTDGYFRPFSARRPVRWRSCATVAVGHRSPSFVIPIEGRRCAYRSRFRMSRTGSASRWCRSACSPSLPCSLARCRWCWHAERSPA